jgi:acyl-coenzyme A thioesterase PaaI-like protein
MDSARHRRVTEALEARMQSRGEDLTIPPPVFCAMQGEFLEFDPAVRSLTARFPVLADQLNPYGTMQGGMIIAAVDNTIGPLSLLVAAASVTRRLEMKYSRSVSLADKFILVRACFVEQKRRHLYFEATVASPGGVAVATGKAVNWVVDGSSK